ncbi:MAG: LPS export ABC transporter ATP-binding protein [Pirellulales bacterium]
MPLLDVQGLVKHYGRRCVVNGVSFKVERGEVVGLLGPNGAGKTTSFRMTCGLVEPDAGKVELNGNDVTSWPMYRRARDAGMGYLAQDSSVFRKLNVEQNLLGMMELLNMGRAERKRRCAELLEQFKITHLRKSNSARLSGGERRRLEIARCLISNPEIVLLDEPFAGIDPVTVEGIRGIILQLKRQGISILITDHAANHILKIADHCYVINKGEVFFHGTAEQVRNHKDVKSTYLGHDDDDVSAARTAGEDDAAEEHADTAVRVSTGDDIDDGDEGNEDAAAPRTASGPLVSTPHSRRARAGAPPLRRVRPEE